MLRVGMTVRIRKELIEEYKAFHRRVWPEVEHRMEVCGFRNVSIFLHEDTLFLYQEHQGSGPIDEAYRAYIEDPKCQEWEHVMSRFQEETENSLPGIRWTRMEEVYHFGGTPS
jgi:L-rhamnose mutarotase